MNVVPVRTRTSYEEACRRMTQHTRIVVTSLGLDPREALENLVGFVGGAQDPRPEETEPSGARTVRMLPDPGAPALVWVEHNGGLPLPIDAQYETHDMEASWLGEGSSCLDYVPEGYLVLHCKTPLTYTLPDGTTCGDLDIWLARKIGEWLASQGVEALWFDDTSGEWLPNLAAYGTLRLSFDPYARDPLAVFADAAQARRRAS